MTECSGESRSVAERIREHFGPDESPALGAAISEAIMCLDPRYLGAIMEELGPGVRSVDACVIWAIRRGNLWAGSGPPPGEMAAPRRCP